jgi:MFS family permease
MLKFVKDYFSEFKVLKTATKEFWIINGIQFFDGLAYFSMITIISLYLTANAGLSDVDSGFWVGIFTLAITIFVMMVGSICDSIGIKKSYYLGFGLLILSRLGLGVAPLFLEGSILAYFAKALLLLMAFGTSMIMPVTNTGLRRFTTKKNRATGFNMYYLIMNVGAVGAGLVVSFFRNKFGNVAGNMAILDFGVAMASITFFLSIILNEHNYADESEKIEETTEKKSPLKIFFEVWHEKPFRKLILFLVLTIGVRLVFTHQFLVMPKYYTRAIYNDLNLGYVNMINPTIIVVGLILVIPIINKFDTVKLIIVGMSISAFSLIPMALPLNWFLGRRMSTLPYCLESPLSLLFLPL